MDAFEQELLRRSPLAVCVLEVCDHVFDEAFLASVWDAHRGRCYEDVLKFGDFLRLTRDALVRHGGSAHAASSNWSGGTASRSTRATTTASWHGRRSR